MSEIILKTKGSFTLASDKSLFKVSENSLSGLYVFKFKIKNRYLIEYIGITARNFKTRFLKHIKDLFL